MTTTTCMRRTWIVLAALLAAVMAVGLACRNAASDQEPAPAAGPMSLEAVKAVLGTAGDFASGVVDLTRDGETVVVAYRFFDPDKENYESDFATELAPRIQALFQRFHELDGIRMDVIANDPQDPGLWKPFVRLELDRKTVEELHWTGFLARYLLDRTIAERR